MSKICVLGGEGFVGTTLINKLNYNKQINKIFCGDLAHRSSKNFQKIDVTSPKSFDCLLEKDIDTIINLAAVHRDDIKPITKYDEVNVEGAKNVCEMAKKYGIKKIIFTSSVAIYGFAPPNTNESGEANYFNDYGRTKYLA